MNRTIKFRVWDHQEESFEKDSSFWIYQSGELDHDSKNLNGYFTIQQFTGLKDANGVEIYEGDIVKLNTYAFKKHGLFNNGVSKIVFEYGSFKIQCLKEESIKFRFSEFDEPNTLKSEEVLVVGNIFENPELLNEQE